MILKDLLKKLESIKRRKGEDIEIRIGGYANSTSEIIGAYFNEDDNNAIVY